MNHTIDQLDFESGNKRTSADEMADAAQAFARAANGHNGHVTPAPVAYDLLGNIKVALWYIKEVAQHLPRGIDASFTDDRIVVVDRDVASGAERDAGVQALIASQHLRMLATALQMAADEAEAAQGALGGQGYEERHV